MIETATILIGLGITAYACFFSTKTNEPQEMKWL